MTSEPVVVIDPETEPPTTEPPTTDTTAPTTTVWREATERIPSEATTTYFQEDPMLPADRERITYGASGPFRLEPGMRLVTDATSYFGFPLDGAWIIGILETNFSTDAIFMYVCIEGVDFEGSQNVVGEWRLARTDTENEYLVIYARNHRDGRRTAAVPLYPPEQWEQRLANNSSDPRHGFDVSECW